jgi:uncharacterized membrane protein
MKVIIILVGSIIALLGILALAVFFIGSRLPVQHVASRSIRLQRPVEDVYATVRNFGESTKWKSDVKSVEMLGTINNHLQFREHGSNGTITYELVEDVANQRMVTRIVDRDLGYSGSWTYEFIPSDKGSMVRITENGEVSNTLFRFMSRYVFGHTSTMDNNLKSLARHYGETSVPEDGQITSN